MITAIVIAWAHFIGDFILQSDYHAVNKSKSNFVLLQHVLLYSIPFVLIGFIIPVSIFWIVLNAALHFVVDYITSRISSKMWLADKRHWFFVTIGADQAVHTTCLLLSYYFLYQYM